MGIGINIFSHPQNLKEGISATSLAAHHLPVRENHIKDLASYLWQELYTNTDSALSESSASHITSFKRGEIKDALNKYPSKIHYKNVLPDGCLETSSGVLSWQDL